MPASQSNPSVVVAIQVFHTDDGGEADKDSTKTANGTSVSQQEVAKQQILDKAATLLEQACAPL